MPHIPHIVDGVEWPSVTDVLGAAPKPWLQAWRDKWGMLAERKTVAASNVGTLFHDAAERLAKGELVDEPMTRRLYGMLEQFEQWRSENVFAPLATETHVVSLKHRYHGTFDAVGYSSDAPGTLSIYDWKTSSAIYPEMQLQLAAYALAYYEQTGVKISEGVIVHVNKQKPKHRLTVKRYPLKPALARRFLKLLAKYKEANA